MAFSYLVGLEVADAARYDEYRRAMRPSLVKYEGDFGCDFGVDRVLFSPEDAPINRVFKIRFPSRERANAFFGDRDYRAVKERYSDAAVAATTILGAYEDADGSDLSQ